MIVSGVDNFENYETKHPIYLKDLYEILLPYAHIRLFNPNNEELDKAPGMSEAIAIEVALQKNEIQYCITVMET